MASTAQDSSAPLRTEKKDEDVDESTSWSGESSFFFSLFFSLSIAQSMQRLRRKDEALSPALLLLSLIKRVETLAEVASALRGRSLNRIVLGTTRGEGATAEPGGQEKKRRRDGFSSSSSPSSFSAPASCFLVSLLPNSRRAIASLTPCCDSESYSNE